MLYLYHKRKINNLPPRIGEKICRGKNIAEEMYDFQNKYGFLERFEELEEKGRDTAAPFEALDSYLRTSTLSPTM